MKLPRNRFWRFAIYVACLLMVLLALDLAWARSLRVIHPGFQTTRIVAPVKDDGEIDYLSAIEAHFGRGVTPENNAVPLLLQAFGRAALPRTQPPDGITNRLGMPHLPEQGDYFVTSADFAKKHAGVAEDPDPMYLSAPLEWPKNPSPVTVGWLKQNETPLAKIREATARPRYFLPFNGGNPPEMLISVLLPHLKLMTDSGRALITRALVRAAAGDVAGSDDDLLAAHRLARLLCQSATLVEHSAANTIEIAACRAQRHIAAGGGRSAAELRAAAAQLAALPDLGAPVDSVDHAERYMMLDATQHLARLNPVEAGRLYRAITSFGTDVPNPELFPVLPVPYEGTMISANHWYDSLVVALYQPTYGLRRDAIAQWEQAFASTAGRSHLGILSTDWAAKVYLPSLSRIQLKWETARAEARLTTVALALAAYKSDRGSYPPSLSDLSPAFIASVPSDNFSDRSFIYARTEKGYTLYSVGPNLLDDGGSATSPGDDIVASAK